MQAKHHEVVQASHLRAQGSWKRLSRESQQAGTMHKGNITKHCAGAWDCCMYPPLLLAPSQSGVVGRMPDSNHGTWDIHKHWACFYLKGSHYVQVTSLALPSLSPKSYPAKSHVPQGYLNLELPRTLSPKPDDTHWTLGDGYGLLVSGL